MGGIEVDTVLKEAQTAALSQLGELSQGGLNLQDKADLANIQGQVAQQDAGRQAAIMQNMAERGMGGAGMELAQRLQSQSSGADRAAADARNVSAMAQQRALDAIAQRGSVGGQIRAQEFGEDAAKAKAQDDINAFNTGNKNQAGMMRQDTSDRKVDATNQERMQGNELAQQRFNNQVTQRAVVDGLAAGRTNQTVGMGEARNKRLSGLGSLGAQALGASK